MLSPTHDKLSSVLSNTCQTLIFDFVNSHLSHLTEDRLDDLFLIAAAVPYVFAENDSRLVISNILDGVRGRACHEQPG